MLKYRFDPAYVVLVVFLLFTLVGLSPPALIGSGVQGEAISSSGNVATQIILTALALAAVGSFFFTGKRPRRVALPLSVIAMIAFCWLSLIWSGYPEFGIRRVISLTFGAAVIGCTVGRLKTFEVPVLLAKVLAGLLIVNVLAVLILPLAIQPAGSGEVASVTGGWRGLHLDKNAAGAVAAAQVLAAIFMALRSNNTLGQRALWWLFAALGLVFLWKTGSKTSFGLVPVAIILALPILVVSRAPVLVGLAALVLVPVGVLFWYVNPDWGLALNDWFEAMLMDPESFTGRSQIWNVVLAEHERAVWLGFGYGSFWLTGANGPVAGYAIDYLAWLLAVPNSHSGYFDMLIQLGLVGLVGAVIAAIVLPLIRLVSSHSIDRLSRWFLSAITIFFLFHNFLETSLFDRINPLWVIQLCIIATISKFTEPAKLRAPWRGAAVQATRVPTQR